MEAILSELIQEASAVKFPGIKTTSHSALELLKNASGPVSTALHELRDKCLEPLQLALESNSNKLSSLAIKGIQEVLRDDRFASALECEEEEHWLPMQVLNTVWMLPSFSENVQVDIMKILLNMTFETVWCMNAKVITKITQLCLDAIKSGTKKLARKFLCKSLVEILDRFCSRQVTHAKSCHYDCHVIVVLIDTYTSSSSGVHSAARATLTQMLSSFVIRLGDGHEKGKEEATPDILSDFKITVPTSGYSDKLAQDIVTILLFLTGRIAQVNSSAQTRVSVQLLLEGIHAILHSVPRSISSCEDFVTYVWQELCPSLISLLANAKAEQALAQKLTNQSGGDLGQRSGCSIAPHPLPAPAAKLVYSIGLELVRVVGDQSSLRPVLESLFQRILMYPPAVNRLDGLKAVRELLRTSQSLLTLTLPNTENSDPSKMQSYSTDLGLLCLIMDCIQECCHCNDSAVCITSVECVNLILTSIEALCEGEGLTLQTARNIQKRVLSSDDYDYEVNKGFHKSRLPLCLPGTDNDDLSHRVVYHPEDDSSDDDNDENYDGRRIENKRITKLTAVKCVGSSTENSDTEELDTDLENEVSLKQNKAKAAGKSSDVIPPRRNYSDLRMWTGGQIKPNDAVSSLQFEQAERESAQEYGVCLTSLLTSLHGCYSTHDVDEALQRFASNFCLSLAKHEPGSWQSQVILNGDGVYVATVSVLLLNLKLSQSAFYSNTTSFAPLISEDEFVDSVLNNGLLLFLSPTWLSELYRLVLMSDVLAQAGHNHGEEVPCGKSTLIKYLLDLDGLGSHDRGAQLMCDQQDRIQPVQQGSDCLLKDAGKRHGRRLLTCCWGSVLDVLSVLLNGQSTCGITSSLSLMLLPKDESSRAREAICASLEGLQRAARLCSGLGLQSCCGSAFEQLSASSCVMEEKMSSSMSAEAKANKGSVLPARPKLVQLHAAHVLSMDVVMTTGLEMGSHSTDCWEHVFRCCAHISHLEHRYFSTAGTHQASIPRVRQGHASEATTNESELDFVTLPVTQALPVTPHISVPELIRESSVESGWERSLRGGGVLSPAQASKALCGLSQEVDRLFEDAANKLNLQALLGFLLELCKTSRHQLVRYTVKDIASGDFGNTKLPNNALHLYRLQDVLMRVLHSGRPLLHVLRAWTVVSPYLIEAAGHRDRNISKMSVDTMHSYITAMVTGHEELAHFHVNELLCKTFENLLCLELCDGDVQDQVVCSICELVEACTAEIRSGWRPLFAALRAVRISCTTNEEVNEARQRHVGAVLDVFEVFLATDNPLVFANATVDCILCLLKYIRGPSEFEGTSDDDSDTDSDAGIAPENPESLCVPALIYLKQCCDVLASMWTMPACPVFNGAHRIQTMNSFSYVDPFIPNMDFDIYRRAFIETDIDKTNLSMAVFWEGINETFKKFTNISEKKSKKADDLEKEVTTEIESKKDHDTGWEISGANEESSRTKRTGIPKKADVANSYEALNLSSLDNRTGILHIWYLVLEGLAGAISVCPKSYQPQTLEVLFGMLRDMIKTPGPEFSLYCVNHLVLPMLQGWLRGCTRILGTWNGPTANFKQCCGLCTDLTVEYIIQLAETDVNLSSLELMFSQMLDVLIECVAQPLETISRLGCACIRHAILSSAPVLTEPMWQIAANTVFKALDVTTYTLRQIMVLFHDNSENFYGDIGQVKVATRNDSTVMEGQRMTALAQQVFLLDTQISKQPLLQYDTEQHKSFVFLLYLPGFEGSVNPDHIYTRVPFPSIIVGLLSHQLLLQTVGSVLLQGCHNPALSSKIPLDSPTHPLATDATNKQHSMAVLTRPRPSLAKLHPHLARVAPELPENDTGFLHKLSLRNSLKFLDCLLLSYRVSCEFDSKPGLKFLFQKVGNTDVAANLYRQSGVCMTYYMSTLVEVCSHITDRNIETTKMSLNMETRNEESETVSVDDSNKKITESTTKLNSRKTVVEKTESSSTVSVWDCTDSVSDHPAVFIRLLQNALTEVGQMYIDLLQNEQGTSAVDCMSDKPLFFLLSPSADDFPVLSEQCGQWHAMLQERLHTQEVADAETQEPGQHATAAAATYSGPLPLDSQETGAPVSTSEPAACVSPPHHAMKHREDAHSRVYTVATDRTIKSLMSEYKKHKQRTTMPSFVKSMSRKKCDAGKDVCSQKQQQQQLTSGEDKDIQKQQKASIMKDGEAHLRSWSELLVTTLQFFSHLDDETFHALLPTSCDAINQLICQAHDQPLRQALSQWMHRVCHMYGVMASRKQQDENENRKMSTGGT